MNSIQEGRTLFSGSTTKLSRSRKNAHPMNQPNLVNSQKARSTDCVPEDKIGKSKERYVSLLQRVNHDPSSSQRKHHGEHSTLSSHSQRNDSAFKLSKMRFSKINSQIPSAQPSQHDFYPHAHQNENSDFSTKQESGLKPSDHTEYSSDEDGVEVDLSNLTLTQLYSRLNPK